MTQDHPPDNSQTEAHGVYEDMVTKWYGHGPIEDPELEGDDNRIPDKYPMAPLFTILWMAALLNASRKQKVPVERLFSDHDRSDLIRFLTSALRSLTQE